MNEFTDPRLLANARQVGSSPRRPQLERFVAGRGQYVADLRRPRTLHAAFARSALAHGRIRSIDTARAAAVEGVVQILTGADIRHMRPQPLTYELAEQQVSAMLPLATDTVLYVGHAVAVVVATSRKAAARACALLQADIAPLPVVAGVEEAMRPDAPSVHAHWAHNRVASSAWKSAELAPLLAESYLVIEGVFDSPRAHALPLETRGVLAEPGGERGCVTLHTPTQSPHQVRGHVAHILGWPEHRLRVVAPDIGGAFGMKVWMFPEEPLLAYLADLLQRPVRWTETRREAFVASLHGRAERVELAMGFTHDGRVTGLKARVVLDKGADPGTVSNGTAFVSGVCMTGAYAIGAIDVEATGFASHRTPTGAYRGFGQPEANFALERALDIAARHLGLDPAEIRRRNFVPPQAMPYSAPTGLVLDSGDYAALMDLTLARFGYTQACARAAQARAAGRLVGVGMAFYTEVTNFAPSWLTPLLGIRTGGFDMGSIRMEPSGQVALFISQTLMGQGLELAMAQICADELGLPIQDILVVANDTQTAAFTGYASGASRGAGVCGSCTTLACRRLATRLKAWGAHLLQLAPEAVTLEPGCVRAIADPAASVAVADIARAAYLYASHPEGLEPGLVDHAGYDPPGLAIPHGLAVCEVEVDPATGTVTLQRLVFGHDCGTQIHPRIVEGQVLGGAVQSVGATLSEEIVYGREAQPLTWSLHDYGLPFAGDLGGFDATHTETPSPFSLTGAKGVGESGTIPIPAAIANAVHDALGGTRGLCELPLTPERVFRYLHG
jgi:carbon-monoxide dehydrogenase large subunit